MKRVLLLSMPMGALGRPALGLSLLQAELSAAGIACDVRYLTFPFAELVGLETYDWLSYEVPYTAFAGDWTFTRALYGADAARERAYLDEVLRATWRMSEHDIARICQVQSLTEPFLTHCLDTVPWSEYAIVGFTSTFEQNIASLALARRLKQRHPEIAIVFGGANWEGEMGLTLHRCFPFVDYVCSGEADESFPALVGRLLRRRPPRADEMPPGVVYRRAGRSVMTPPAPPLRALDDLPIPEFGAYFADLDNSTVAAGVLPILLFESWRGCWWGAKSHCTFCGLNGGSMAFRSKSAARVLDEIHALTARWRIDLIEAVDNILDMAHFATVLPALAADPHHLSLFYEVKANLKRRHVELLHAAGVDRIQPGIESLNDHVLALMRKGTTALRNVQLLKWGRACGVTVEWNILYGFPGETAADYEQILELLRAIRWLDPPTACGPIRLDRFSPYHATPAAFGLRNVRPMAPYRFLYPFDEATLNGLAYYFTFDYGEPREPESYAAEVITFVADWRSRREPGGVSGVRQGDGSLRLIDTRSDARRSSLVLRGYEQAAYEYCDEVRSAAQVAAHLAAQFPGQSFDCEAVDACLASLVDNRLMVSDETHYLALAILAPPLQPAASPPPPFTIERAAPAPPAC